MGSRKIRRRHRKGRGWWNGERADVSRVFVEVGPAPEGWWCYGLAGLSRAAVRVVYGGQTFYIDDEDPAGSGWSKVTVGRGSPALSHRSVPVARELGSRL